MLQITTTAKWSRALVGAGLTLFLCGCIGTGIRVGPLFIPVNTETAQTKAEREKHEQEQQQKAAKKAAEKDANEQNRRDDELDPQQPVQLL